MTAIRLESDTFGMIGVPAERLWGAQTQRSLQFFQISNERMPAELIRALAQVKPASPAVIPDLGKPDPGKPDTIMRACDEVLVGWHDADFSLSVWQIGSGTQTNINMNEVLANRASELLGGERGEARKLSPNDDVNCGQSSNDVFPTAMHVSAAMALDHSTIPGLRHLRNVLAAKASEMSGIVKIGRTHLQDATPLTLAQELSGWVAQLDSGLANLEAARPGLFKFSDRWAEGWPRYADRPGPETACPSSRPVHL